MLTDPDILRESHDNLQETHDTLASNSSRDIRSLRAQLDRNTQTHTSELHTLRSELETTTSIIYDLRNKLEIARRARFHAEEQRDKFKSEVEELRSVSAQTMGDLERRLGREVEKVRVLEDLVGKMEVEIERSTMASGRRSVTAGEMSVHPRRETDDDADDEEEDDEDEDHDIRSPTGKHSSHVPGSPVKTLFAEMEGMEDDEEVEEEEEDEVPRQYSAPTSPESSVSIPSMSVAQVLQSLRETEDVETVERGVQTDTPHTVPSIRILSPTPPLTNAPIIEIEMEIEKISQSTQTAIVDICSQAVQTDPAIVVSPLFQPAPQLSSPPPPIKSPILRPQNSIRRGSHSVRWQEEKAIQTETEQPKTVIVGIQTDPFIISKVLKPALKSPTSDSKEVEQETIIRLEKTKSYDGPTRKEPIANGGTAKVGPTRRFEAGNRGSIVFGVMGPQQINSHERKTSNSSFTQALATGRKVTVSHSHTDLRRGRPPQPNWQMASQSARNAPVPPSTHSRPQPAIQLHTPTGMLHSTNGAYPPLPIPQRSSSKFRVVLPIVRRDSVPEETLSQVAEEESQFSADDQERTRRQVNEFLSRPPRKTVRQIRSAINLRTESQHSSAPPTPDAYTYEAPRHGMHGGSHTPSISPPELAQKAFSTPRRQPKRLLKARPQMVTQHEISPTSNASPMSPYFPTSEEMSVVDEIARCMVGEFMYKYVRKRRRGSFGWRRSPSRHVGGNDEYEESTVRHKRWVWLQPYEKYFTFPSLTNSRMIMWSAVQPSQSNFLQRAQVKKRTLLQKSYSNG